jgi:hypothetical protein
LILDGAPAENIYGTDLRQGFFGLGKEFFRDKDTLKSHFVAANIFEPNEELDALSGTFSIIYAGAFYHLFDRPKQLQMIKRTISLLSPTPGSFVLGRQVGNVTSGRWEHATNDEMVMFRHNEKSWRELWEQAGQETGTKWDVWVELVVTDRWTKFGGSAQGGARQLNFVVSRL